MRNLFLNLIFLSIGVLCLIGTINCRSNSKRALNDSPPNDGSNVPNSQDLITQMEESSEKAAALPPQANSIQELQQKMDTNIRNAVDTVNQLIESTNHSMSIHYAERQRRLQETYQRLIADVQLESVAAHSLLDRLIVNSSTIISSMQAYYDRMMTSTVQRAYGDMNDMLTNAIRKIQSICLEIVDKFKSANPDLQEMTAATAKKNTSPTLADVIVTGLDQIEKLADKFKYDANKESGVAGNNEIDPVTQRTIDLARKLLSRKSAQLARLHKSQNRRSEE